MKKGFYLLMGLIVLFFMATSCTNYHFGVPDRALGVPPEFSQTEEAIARAEQSSGAKYCPEKIAKAKELATKGVETYWACRTAEAMGLLAEARDLAKQAEGCQPPPPPAPPKPAPAPAPPVEKDSDNDGVPDSRDKCPGTPAGVAVDKDGCPLDSDKDGVPDYLDKCPGTPAGVAVDKDGCPLDSDKDGVPDYLDKCPGTPAGVTVDKDGCPPAPKVIDKIILHVLFDLDKSTLKLSSLDELQKAVAFVKKYPGANVRLDGYTDSLGTDAYNIKLSERRAAAVRDYLIKEAGVDSSKITAVGHGKADPVADNKTAEGRAKNRRVEVSILSD
jgi:OOP family OmpA-OmpF porin